MLGGQDAFRRRARLQLLRVRALDSAAFICHLSTPPRARARTPRAETGGWRRANAVRSWTGVDCSTASALEIWGYTAADQYNLMTNCVQTCDTEAYCLEKLSEEDAPFSPPPSSPPYLPPPPPAGSKICEDDPTFVAKGYNCGRCALSPQPRPRLRCLLSIPPTHAQHMPRRAGGGLRTLCAAGWDGTARPPRLGVTPQPSRAT